MVSNFDKSSEFGKKGEKAGIEILEELFAGGIFNDVSLDKEYQKLDIDLIIKYEYEDYKIEIKTDKTAYKNLFLEVISSLERGTPGWFSITEADYIFYGFSLSGDIYFIPVSFLRELLEERSFCEKEAYENVGAGTKTSVGVIVPVSFVSDYYIGNFKSIYDKYIGGN